MKSQNLTLIVLLLVVVVLGADFIRRSLSSSRVKKTEKPKTEQKNPAVNPPKSTIADSIAKTYAPSAFRDKQLENQRVKVAYREKDFAVQNLYDSLKLDRTSLNIYIRAFKKDEIVEVWAKDKNKPAFALIKTYKFCKNTGTLGPKRKAGDNQIPEGFYHIDRFNPQSKFYLSLGLNYPNKIDKIIGDTTNLGSDIFIHGDCQTIGCIPITDDKIKELYVLAVDARAAGQTKIAVTIYPTYLTEANYKILKTEFAKDTKLLRFWKGLKDGFQQFEKCRKLPNVTFLATGEYKCTSSCN
jgi:murein L,D-transpeptidase YafK